MHKQRIIALVLAIFAIFTGNVFAWESAETDSFERARNVLYALGIFDTVTNDGYNDEDVLTRAELADVVMRMTGVYDSAGYVDIFEDVTEDTEHAKSITTLAAMGVIAEDENFYPEEPALFEHAVKMIVYLLGYDAMVEYQGGWLAPVFSVASDVGLTKGISAGRGDEVNARLMTALAYNALDCDVMERTASNEFVTKEEVTLLNERFDIYKTEGIVTANNKTSLTAGKSRADEVEIDGIAYSDKGEVGQEFLGMDVCAYYYDDKGNYDIIYVYPTNRNNVMTVKAPQIEEDTSGFGYTSFYYSDAGNLRKIKISENADVIYNGRAYPEYTDETFKINSGNVKFIDNDNDNEADVVFVNESENYVVDVINTDKMQIYDMYGKYLILDEVEHIAVSDMFGSPISFSQIARWNVLSVFVSIDGEVVEIVAYDDPVIGEVESVSEEDGETYVTIDGDTFPIAESYERAVEEAAPNAKKIMLGQSGTYYLDGDEKIAAVMADSTNSWNYGFMIRAYYDEALEYSRFKILTDNSGAKFYDGADSIRIDGYKKEGAEIYRALCIDEDGLENVILDPDSEEYPDTSDISNLASIPQLIKFMLNGQGQITRIDTARMTDKESEEGNLNKEIDGATEHWSVRTGRFGENESVGVLVNPSNTLIFEVPTGNEIYNEEKYSIRTNNFENNAQLTYDAYDVDFSGIAKVAVVYNATDSETIDYAGMIIVTDASTAVDANNEISVTVTGINYSGTTVSYAVNQDVDTSQVSPGDLLSYKLDYQNRIEEIYMWLDRENDLEYSVTSKVFNHTGDYTASYTSNAPVYLTKNIIADKQGNFIKAMIPGTTIATVTKGDINFSNSQTYDLSGANIFLYDSSSKFQKIRTITPGELEEYVYFRNKDARAMILTTYTQLRAVYVYI